MYMYVYCNWPTDGTVYVRIEVRFNRAHARDRQLNTLRISSIKRTHGHGMRVDASTHAVAVDIS